MVSPNLLCTKWKKEEKKALEVVDSIHIERYIFESSASAAGAIIDDATIAEAQRRQQTDHLEVLDVRVNLDAWHLLHFAKTSHASDEFLCQSLTLKFG